MTFPEWMQAIGAIGSIVAGAVSARWGHNQVLQRLERYVTVTEYREKISALHIENNDLKVRVAVLEERARK